MKQIELSLFDENNDLSTDLNALGGYFNMSKSVIFFTDDFPGLYLIASPK